jgi:hypothetical protein
MKFRFEGVDCLAVLNCSPIPFVLTHIKTTTQHVIGRDSLVYSRPKPPASWQPVEAANCFKAVRTASTRVD